MYTFLPKNPVLCLRKVPLRFISLVLIVIGASKRKKPFVGPRCFVVVVVDATPSAWACRAIRGSATVTGRAVLCSWSLSMFEARAQAREADLWPPSWGNSRPSRNGTVGSRSGLCCFSFFFLLLYTFFFPICLTSNLLLMSRWRASLGQTARSFRRAAIMMLCSPLIWFPHIFDIL